MRIVFDLDGVLRDLNGYLESKFDIPYPQEWYWNHQGKNIFDWIEQDHFATLVYAPATEYERIAKFNFEQLEIWTNQPEKWILYTTLWLTNHFPDAIVHYLNTQEKQEWLKNNPDTYLVEDCPLFTDYSQILLIDRPYNRHLVVPHRIHSAEELSSWILSRMEK
jgi:hypothetical protein